MTAEKIISRKNRYISHVRTLASDAAYREAAGEFLCDGVKTLREALTFGAEIVSVLWKDEQGTVEVPDSAEQYVAPAELFDYASPMKNSPGPLFAVRIPEEDGSAGLRNAIVLERVQDPGNVGTVIRTASAFEIGAVILTGDCADLYNPKTVRATMGAIFRERVIRKPLSELAAYLEGQGLRLYGAALSDRAEDMRRLDVSGAAVAIGNEGNGLSRELLGICEKELIIPMDMRSESLNAAVAASVIMWEMARNYI